MTHASWVIATRPGGWLLLVAQDGARFQVRFALSETGRLEPVELYVPPGGWQMDARSLGRLPVMHAVTRANSPDLRAAILEQLDQPPLPGVDPPVPLWQPPGPLNDVKQAVAIRRRRSTRLMVPEGPRKPDSFYRRVAVTYSALADHSTRPAAELAEANGVPTTTVHRWVKEARKRGFLAPGHKGRRG
jgi:hypothetical protein